MSTIVELRPLPSEKWHGKKGKDNFSQDHSTEILVDSKSRKYATGLTQEEADIYGKELGVDLTDTFNPAEPHPYWSQKAAKLDLPNKTLVFDTSFTINKVKVANYKASAFVANSMKEFEQGLWPNATHVLYDEGEHTELKAVKINNKRQAYKLADKLTKEQKIAIVQIMLDISVRKQSNDFIEVKLEEAIESNLSTFISLAKSPKEKLYIRGMVFEALYKNILTKEGLGIYYMGDILGHGIDDVVDYFCDTNNLEIKARILEKIQK